MSHSYSSHHMEDSDIADLFRAKKRRANKSDESEELCSHASEEVPLINNQAIAVTRKDVSDNYS